MNEEKNTSQQPENYMHPQGCMCWHHGGMHSGMGFWVLRLVFCLAALLVVFWMGVKIGEIKSYMREQGGFGGRTNMMYNTQGRYFIQQQPPMMFPYNSGTVQQLPSTYSTSTPKTK